MLMEHLGLSLNKPAVNRKVNSSKVAINRTSKLRVMRQWCTKKKRTGALFQDENIYFTITTYVISMKNTTADRNNLVGSGHILNTEKRT